MENRIAKIRREKNMKQKKLAEIIGTTQGRLSDYERGRISVENITLGTAEKIAKALECTISDLFEDRAELYSGYAHVFRIKEVSGELEHGVFKIEPGCSQYLIDTNDEVVKGSKDYATKEEALNALSTYKSWFNLYRGTCGYFYSIHEYYAEEVIIDENGEEMDCSGDRDYAKFDKLSNEQIIDILEAHNIAYSDTTEHVYALFDEYDELMTGMTVEEMNNWLVSIQSK